MPWLLRWPAVASAAHAAAAAPPPPREASHDRAHRHLHTSGPRGRSRMWAPRRAGPTRAFGLAGPRQHRRRPPTTCLWQPAWWAGALAEGLLQAAWASHPSSPGVVASACAPKRSRCVAHRRGAWRRHHRRGCHCARLAASLARVGGAASPPRTLARPTPPAPAGAECARARGTWRRRRRSGAGAWPSAVELPGDGRHRSSPRSERRAPAAAGSARTRSAPGLAAARQPRWHRGSAAPREARRVSRHPNRQVAGAVSQVATAHATCLIADSGLRIPAVPADCLLQKQLVVGWGGAPVDSTARRWWAGRGCYSRRWAARWTRCWTVARMPRATLHRSSWASRASPAGCRCAAAHYQARWSVALNCAEPLRHPSTAVRARVTRRGKRPSRATICWLFGPMAGLGASDVSEY